MENRHVVTLVGKGQAVVGGVFLHKGLGSKCQSCKYSQVCIRNLESNRVYKIVKVRNKTLPCDLFEMEMQVVEVVDAEIATAIPSKQAIQGATVTVHLLGCNQQDCGNYGFCFPVGLKDGDRCEILAVTESLRCLQGLPLKRVILRQALVS